MSSGTSSLNHSLKKFFFNLLLGVLVLIVGLGSAEILLRLKNANQRNYNIEMWRYSTLLKKKSDDPQIGHEHRKNVSAKLQGVEIRLNSLGMRQPEPDLTDTKRQRVLFLGSSMTLGWGVEEKETLPSRIQQALADRIQVFNAGIGNYNANRYVRMFEREWKNLKPDVVVVHYFVRDGEDLEPGGGNFLLRNSELAVTLYHLYQINLQKQKGEGNLVEHYQRAYAPGSPGREKMEKALARLNELAKENHFAVILAMTPESHAIDPYPFQFIHDEMKKIAQQYGWTYVDFTRKLHSVPAETLWVMPGDPHYNALGHKLMAEELLPVLKSVLDK